MARVVRVLPDVPAIDKTFDYLVPDSLGDQVRFGDIGVGTMVRIVLHGRRVGGWVVADGVEPPPGVTLRALAKVTGRGPSSELIELAHWAAWRWAGRPAHFLRTASPPRSVRGLPPRPPSPSDADWEATGLDPDALALEALGRDGRDGRDGRARGAGSSPAVIRLPPSEDPLGVVAAVARLGTTLVVTPSHAAAAALGKGLRQAGIATAVMPGDWPLAAAGARVVVGARASVWAPAVGLAGVVVLDEHDEALQEESAPTWHAREVAVERARSAGVPCLLVSPCPSLEALAVGPLLVASRARERAGWPIVDVIDRRREEPRRVDLYAPRLLDLIHLTLDRGAKEGVGRVVCVLNRKGRARLLACVACAELARCTACGAAVGAVDDDTLTCPRCETSRPMLCLACGSGRLKVLRLGVSRARDDLERLLGVSVGEVTGELGEDEPLPGTPVLVGTEAVLHRAGRADLVAFLDLDSALLAPRYRAGEETMALLARAARLVDGRRRAGRLVLQTRVPHHEVVQAVLHADPSRVAVVEGATRAALRLPPEAAMAELSGAGAEAYASSLSATSSLEVLGPVRDRYLVRAGDHRALCDTLAATPRPPGRLRVAVDPARL